ncbi:MAG: Bacteriophage tail sheath protein [Bacteroidetes bacterium]|nr:Bacteriophage tail sheath protein [Bacteroidota bacterium]
MATYTTPGVYIEEIPVLPASIAGVSTAVPAFIGYVEKAESNGVGIPFNTPVRLTSFIEYQTIFGGADGQNFSITVNDNITVTPTLRTVTVVKNAESRFKLFYNMQMYFANGGGPCYVVPVGLYSIATFPLGNTDMLAGLDAIAKVDEPTLLLFPDGVSLSTANRKVVYDQALLQCDKLGDRFVIMDVVHTVNKTVVQDADDFRNNGVGPDNLKYGASYYPFLNTTLGFGVDQNLTHITSQTQTVTGPTTSPYPNSAEVIDLLNKVEISVSTATNGFSNAKIRLANLSTAGTIATFATNIKTALSDITAAIGLAPTEFGVLSASVTAAYNTANTGGTFATANSDYTGAQTQTKADALIAAYNQMILALAAIRTLAYSTLNNTPSLSVFVVGSLADLQSNNPALYNAISPQLASYSVQLNPSGAMAGIYARVDNDRGVWKAPANVGVLSITGPSINVTATEQGGLNVDATSGKSINVIRSFTGRGTLVWGARTLAGNDNEWRYINVRRLFIYVEESVAEATEFVVFEPNTANTWQRIKGMIEAFLTGLWRDGALAGATTKDAYFVRVGLGVTMTAQDILEGRMIVEIGMAAVRPAEFIILRFEHKLQES